MKIDSKEFFDNLQQFQNKYLEAMQLLGQKKIDYSSHMVNFSSLQEAYLEAVTDFAKNPAKFMQHNLEYAGRLSDLMFSFYNNIYNNKLEPLYTAKYDRRFKNEAWHNSLYFNFIKQFYLMSSEWYRSLVKQLEVPTSQRHLLQFYTEQLINAACPTNFANFNPEVINELVTTNGKNLIQGIENFINDIQKSEALFNISTCKTDLFNIGENIASTKGKIIYQNELMQLICYEPQELTHKIPVFIIPAWINKYYILDLSSTNSFVKYLVDQGFQVYLVSWVNPNAALANKNFEDYLKSGIVEPIEFLQKQFNYSSFNFLGYCLGGTLTTCALAYFKAKGKEQLCNSATFLTTLLDFADPGELGLFINAQTFETLKQQIHEQGYFCGKYMAYTFSLLRANDLIWSFVINNYLLGKEPLAFDLLYWNADSTNLPAAMHSFYFENMYLYNNLIKAGGMQLLETPIDISQISAPLFFLSAKDDHIAPWDSTYAGAKYIAKNNANIEFCLAASGHIAGVVNAPQLNKYNYWVNNKIAETSAEWFEGAIENKGSWWPYWTKWLSDKSGSKTTAIDYAKVNAIEEAPGSYVRVRL